MYGVCNSRSVSVAVRGLNREGGRTFSAEDTVTTEYDLEYLSDQPGLWEPAEEEDGRQKTGIEGQSGRGTHS